MARTTVVVRARQCAGRSTAAVMGLSKRLGRARKAQLRRWFNGRLKDVALTARPFSATGRQEAWPLAARAQGQDVVACHPAGIRTLKSDSDDADCSNGPRGLCRSR